jgi:putative addiction module component (TIGR02574 family)
MNWSAGWSFTVGFLRGCNVPSLAAPRKARYKYGMELTLEEIEAHVMRLPADSRALLANKIAESLGSAESAEIEEAWAIETRRRLDEFDSGKVKAIPADDVFAEARRITGG